MSIREDLLNLQDESYKAFHSKLTNTKYKIIGVRLPNIKRMAKNLDLSLAFYYFDCLKSPFFEEIMLEGLCIGELKDINLVINRLDAFVNKIDDWSINDSLVSNLKITKKYKDIMWNYIIKYKNSDKEFEVRFMIVMMMSYYLDKKYIEDIFDIIDSITLDKYYVKMAIAWLLATSIVKCEKETIKYLENCKLDKYTFNKMISKCNDSYRVRKDLKDLLKKMRKKYIND